MEIDAKYIKQIAFENGADLCGITSVDRYEKRIPNFHPQDALPACRSVVVFAGRFLNSTFYADSLAPYTIIRNEISAKMDRLSIRVAEILESHNIIAVPTGAISPCNWDSQTKKVRGLISLKYAGYLAGLGRIGKNTLLINNRYGNMIWLSAVLISADVEPDPMADYEVCIENCTKCIDACKVHALDGKTIKQSPCRNYAFRSNDDAGDWRIQCYECRKACPNRFGLKNNKE